jgi:hypothetical protein
MAKRLGDRGRDVVIERVDPRKESRGDNRGDLLIRGPGMDCITDVRVTDADAKSNRFKDPAKVLAAHQRERNRKEKKQ